MAGQEQAFALVLAGGGGTRLWPASRRWRPKQMLALGGEETLIEASFRRAAEVFGAEHTLVVTAADQAEGAAAALPRLTPENLIAEPAARSTAAAVGLGTVRVAQLAGQAARIAVFPSDAYVADERAFAETLRRAITAAADAIVTIGMRPTEPATGFGYLLVGRPLGEDVFEVVRFIEKPDLSQAQAYFSSGDYLWNSGMFFFTAGRFLAETRRHMPELARVLEAILAADDPRAVADALYPSVPAISIDYGIMERAAGLRVVRGDFGWNDVGSWAALDSIRAADAAGNVVSGDVLLLDGRGNLVLSEPGAPFVGLVGVENLAVVATKDAVLVVPKSRAQEVRQIVDRLKADGRRELL